MTADVGLNAQIVTLIVAILVFAGTIYSARPSRLDAAAQKSLQDRMDSFGMRLERFGTRMDTYSEGQTDIRDDVRQLHACLDDVQKDVKTILTKLNQPLTIEGKVTLDEPPKD